MSFLFGRKGKHVPKNAVWRITQEGREKLSDFNGNPESQVLVALESHGSSSVEEISQESGISRGQVERITLKLAKSGRIQLVNAGADSEDID